MHADALTKETGAVFSHFKQFAPFYLVGGSALALQIGHRLSIDLDFFSKEELSPGLLPKIKRVFSDVSVEVTLRTPEQLNLLINNIKTTFFFYPYPVIEPFVKYKEVPLASVSEIAAMKALAVGKRLSYKDYIDWYFLLHDVKVGLAEVIALSEKKFGGDFNDRLFLEQLASLSDIPAADIVFLRDEVSRETVEAFLIKTVRAFAL